MYFDSFEALLAMDGHGMFVWSAYLVPAAVLAYMLLSPVRRRRRLLREFAAAHRQARGAAATRGDS
jgi:heme exporter protein D